MIKHLQQYKIQITGPDGSSKDKNSAWASYQIQDKNTNLFNCVLWNPEDKFSWNFKKPVEQAPAVQSDRIYEAHVGMAGEQEKVNTYRDFADFNVPMIKNAGYNVIQLMAI